MRLRHIALWFGLVAVLGTVNVLTGLREQQANSGQVVFLSLAPVDPRSLLQGDYMILRYAISAEASRVSSLSRTGSIVVTLDERNIGQFARIHTPDTPLKNNEILIKYRARNRGLWLGPESFFFQEGDAAIYRSAEYAELRVSNNGSVLLVGLRGPDLEPLGGLP